MRATRYCFWALCHVACNRYVDVSMSDRIKLAEAMGWRQFNEWIWLEPTVSMKFAEGLFRRGQHIQWSTEDDLPDPENDANDDYAVLEWMRIEFTSDQIGLALLRLGENAGGPISLSKYYQIGDYARAALKVME